MNLCQAVVKIVLLIYTLLLVYSLLFVYSYYVVFPRILASSQAAIYTEQEGMLDRLFEGQSSPNA